MFDDTKRLFAQIALLRRASYGILVAGVSLLVTGDAAAQGPEFAIRSITQGLSDVVRSASQEKAGPSQIMIDRERARSMNYDNRIKHTQTYFQNRQLNRMYRAAERGPRKTQSQIANYYAQQAPDRLNSNQYNPYTGAINWPVLIRESRYAARRSNIDKLFAMHVRSGGGINTTEYAPIQRALRDLETEFKKHMMEAESAQRIYTRKFLESLKHEARFTVGS